MTRFHSHSLRKGRYSGENQIYLITTVTYLRQPLFSDFSVGRIAVQIMKNLNDSKRVVSLAFVVMPDHIHWLIQLQHESLDIIMHTFKGVTARKINQHLGLQGKVWQAIMIMHYAKKRSYPQLQDILLPTRYVLV